MIKWFYYYRVKCIDFRVYIYILNKIIIKNFNLFFCRNKMEWISYNELCEVEIFL